MKNISNRLDNYSNIDLMNVTFEFIFRFRKIPIEEIINGVRKIIKNNELKNNKENFLKNDLMKFSYLLTKFELLKFSENEVQSSFNYLAELFIFKGLQNLNSEEIKKIIINFTKNKFPPNLDLFTLLEPYIIRDINNYEYKSLLIIFSSYIKNFKGSDFFIKTVGFNLGCRLIEANIDGNYYLIFVK